MEITLNDAIDAKMTATEAATFLGTTVQHVHKQLKQKQLAAFKNQNRVYFGYETSKEIFKVKFKPRTISIQIVKGGTGKTSLTHAFAIRANLYGAKVLCIDLDQQGNLTQAFNINPKETPVMIDIINGNVPIGDAIVNISPGLDIIPSRIENAVLDNHLMLSKHPLDRVYAQPIKELQQNYDIVLIDCPPALGQSVAAATLASDTVIAPVTPEQFSLSGLCVSYEEIKSISSKFDKNEIALKIVLNKFDTRTALSTEVLTTILSHEVFKNLLCQTFIRSCQEFPNTIYSGSNIFTTLKSTSAKEDVDLLVREILNLSSSQEVSVAA